MADLNKVILYLQNKSKNLGQNQDNLKSFLANDYEYSPDLAENLIDEAVQANIVKSIIFNGKISYRIVKTDSVETLLYRYLIRKLITRKMKEPMLIQYFWKKIQPIY